MKISIITATRNSENTISDAINSLANQSYVDVEHIIIDGASRDSTVNIILNKKNDNTKIYSEKDNGIYDALNKGIDAASGDIIGFLHSDDVLQDESSISNVVNAFSSGEYNAVYGNLDYVFQHNLSKVARRWVSGEFTLEKLKNGWMPPHPAFYMTKDLYERLGKYDQNYQISADYDGMLRYLLSGELKLKYLPMVLTKMRLGGVSNKSIKNIMLKTKEDFSIMEKHGLPAIRCILGKNFSKLRQFIV